MDPSLFQLLCTSRRLIKINPAAKLGWNAFFLFSFFFFFLRLLLTFCKGLENTSSSGRLRKRVWNPSRLLVRRDRRVGRDMKGPRQTSACRRAEMGLISQLTCGPSAGSDRRARFSGDRAQGNLLWFKIDKMPKRRWEPIHQSFSLSNCSSHLRPNKAPPTIFFDFISLLFSPRDAV